MAGTTLHDLHQALDWIRHTYYENQITETQFREQAKELIELWVSVEVNHKANIDDDLLGFVCSNQL